MTMEPVAALDELEEGAPFVTSVGRRKVVLTKWRGDVYALKDVCPHQSSSFLGGRATPKIVASAPGEVECVYGSPALICPWHAWQFDLATGDCISSSQFRVKAYPTEIRDGTVYVNFEHGAENRRGAAGGVPEVEPIGA